MLRSIVLLVLFFCLITDQVNSYEPVRIWKGDPDNGAIHALGNGRFLVYEQGPQIMNVFPGPYSIPSFYKVVLSSKVSEVRSTRETGTAIWIHNIFRGNELAGKITDFVDNKLSCLVRHIETKQPLSFEIALKDYVRVLDYPKIKNSYGTGGAVLLFVPHGTTIYQTFVYPRIIYHQIAWKGDLSLTVSENDPHKLIISCDPGTSDLFFIGGPELPQTIENKEEILRLGTDSLIKRTKLYWNEFTGRRLDFNRLFKSDLPEREKLLRIIDDVAVLIKCQQSVEGAVMAGYPYPLGYVRDQYGVSRGLLAAGCHTEAKAILSFYWQIWKRTGKLHNAQTIGLEAIQFHIHENDDVESPGYLIMQAFDLFDKTGDTEFLREIFPMLQWAFEVQKVHLVKGMLPFNGDETYIAGGLLPRSVINDGSSEATMLFIESGKKLLDWIMKHQMWSRKQMVENQIILKETEDQFLNNFWMNNRLVANNPSRIKDLSLPRFRHGVCERRGPDCLVFPAKGFGGITWTERDSNNRYQCANCMALGPLPKENPTTYQISSVSFTPVYFYSSLIGIERLRPVLKETIDRFLDVKPESSTDRWVGYDPGMLLIAAVQMNDKRAENLYRKTLSLADATGAWSEYYLNGNPQGTRCRPWESAINLEALIRYASNSNY